MGVKKRVLIAHPRVNPAGGGNAVAAWALEALRDHFDVSLATLQDVDYAAVNRSFGTSLRKGDFTILIAPRRYRMLLEVLPTSGALLELCLTMRFAQTLDGRGHYDILLGTQNEIDFHRRGLQYIHHPWAYMPRPEHEMRWFHRIPGMLSGYRGLCQWIARSKSEGMRRNLSLANSKFIAGRLRETHGVESVILYPPVPGTFPAVPWERRQRGFVGLGRINGSKRWEMAVEILDALRQRGHDLTLTLIGHSDDPVYKLKIDQLAAPRPWFICKHDMSREELAAEIAQYRYAIHPMLDEHFGIAPAELQRAGCVLFAHNPGGPIEIVDGDSRRLFHDVEDAVAKIERMLTVPELEDDLRRHVALQRDRFTAETFCKGLRDIVGNYS